MAINGGKGWNGSMAERDGNGLKARNGCNGGKILKVSGMNGIDSR
jgi:hypothetical protein